MATYTDNYALEKPTYAELADVAVLNRNMDKVDDVMHSSQVSLAPAYEESETYNTDDVVMYEMLMYKCLEDNVTGAWDGTKWERTTASECGGGGSVDFDIFGEGSGSVVTITDGAEAGLAECIVEIEATQSGSGTPSPSNVRPIVGRSEVNVSVSGKNKNAYPYVAGTRVISDVSFTMNNDGTITLSGTATAQADYILNGAWASSNNILPSGNYKTYIGDNIPNGIELICVYNTTRLTPVDNVINAPNGITYSFIRIANGTNTNGIKLFPMITLSTTPEGFEPYITPEVTNIPLDRTVYGGTLDVTRGILTVTKKYATFNDISTWTYDSARTRFQTGHITDMKTVAGSVVNDIITSCTQMYSNNQAWDGHIDGASWTSDDYFYVSLHDYTSVTDLLNAIGNEQIVYTLATPQTFTLTTEEVSTILGYNNISADSGEISVVYVKQTAPIKPNPTGADIPLKGIEIDGEKFKIESGGYHKALIWDSGSPTTGASYATDYALLDNLSNYNQIILMVSTTEDRADANHQYTQQVWLDVEYLLSSGAWHNANVTGYGTRYFDVSFTDSSFKIIQGGGEYSYIPTIFQIYGVRY